MPRTAIHVIVLDEVIRGLKTSDNEVERKLGMIMSQHRSAAVLGAIGPDLFFGRRTLRPRENSTTFTRTGRRSWIFIMRP
jgi:hypothetical protein